MDIKFKPLHNWTLDSWEGVSIESQLSGTPIDFVTVMLAMFGESEENIRLARNALTNLMSLSEVDLDLTPIQGKFVGMICNRERTFQYPIVSLDGRTWYLFDGTVYTGSIRSLINQVYYDITNRIIGLRAIESQKDIRFWSLYMIEGSKFAEHSIYCTDRNTLKWHRDRLQKNIWRATDVSKIVKLPSVPHQNSSRVDTLEQFNPFDEEESPEIQLQMDEEVKHDRKRPRDENFFIDKVGNKRARKENQRQH